jgi:alpha-L-fucosidase
LFYQKRGALYAFVLDWPDETVHIKSLNKGTSKIKSIKLLGSDEVIKWNQTDEALIIEVPKNKFCEHAFTFKVLVY